MLLAQTAPLLVTFAGLLVGRPGPLHPPGPGWPWHRLVWVPVFALTPTRLFRRFE